MTNFGDDSIHEDEDFGKELADDLKKIGSTDPSTSRKRNKIRLPLFLHGLLPPTRRHILRHFLPVVKSTKRMAEDQGGRATKRVGSQMTVLELKTAPDQGWCAHTC